jgi:DNA-binding NarL/FixJ family response regulator
MLSAEFAGDVSRTLTELRALDRELLELSFVRRSDGIERVRDALRRLGEIGSPAGIVARSAEELGLGSDFDVVLVSRLDGAQILPTALWAAPGTLDAPAVLERLARGTIALRYPLVEADAAARHRGLLVSVKRSGSRAAPDLVAALGWTAYVTAPIMLEADTFGLLHAARRSVDAELDEVDLQLVEVYATGLAQALERATLREQLQRQRLQLEAGAQWLGARIHELSLQPAAAVLASEPNGDRAAALLTARELEVMRLIVRGQSNRAIATTLVLGEGTVKYHVKNILRKLAAHSRAEAVSRYLRVYGGGAR